MSKSLKNLCADTLQNNVLVDAECDYLSNHFQPQMMFLLT